MIIYLQALHLLCRAIKIWKSSEKDKRVLFDISGERYIQKKEASQTTGSPWQSSDLHNHVALFFFTSLVCKSIVWSIRRRPRDIPQRLSVLFESSVFFSYVSGKRKHLHSACLRFFCPVFLVTFLKKITVARAFPFKGQADGWHFPGNRDSLLLFL